MARSKPFPQIPYRLVPFHLFCPSAALIPGMSRLHTQLPQQQRNIKVRKSCIDTISNLINLTLILSVEGGQCFLAGRTREKGAEWRGSFPMGHSPRSCPRNNKKREGEMRRENTLNCCIFADSLSQLQVRRNLLHSKNRQVLALAPTVVPFRLHGRFSEVSVACSQSRSCPFWRYIGPDRMILGCVKRGKRIQTPHISSTPPFFVDYFVEFSLDSGQM